jgi:hypothetical protein
VLHKSAPHEFSMETENHNSHPASIGDLIIKCRFRAPPGPAVRCTAVRQGEKLLQWWGRYPACKQALAA